MSNQQIINWEWHEECFHKIPKIAWYYKNEIFPVLKKKHVGVLFAGWLNNAILKVTVHGLWY